MCGIVGFAGRDRIEPDRIALMRDTMTHRGPDDLGLWTSGDGTVSLAQRRLAIIDLSPGGHQPMANADGDVHVTFNGEIYNYLEVREELVSRGHSFRSASDTEVILAAYREWGEGFLAKLGGMYAMALYDATKRALYLARDRAGEKPLFVWETPNRIVFASELKALFAYPEFPRRLDAAAVEHYLAFGYVPRDLCIIHGVRKLLPGCALRYDIDTGRTHDWRYWDLPEQDSRANERSAEDLADELHELLRGAVRRQLIADVPVGILLSGGIDSSLVTAMAASVSSQPVKTFTISFPGHAAQDEAPYARIVARHFGTDHKELPAEEASLEILPRLVRQFDEPIADSSAIPTYLVSRAIREHATVALGGDGGDELFGGYPQYIWGTRIARAQSLIPSPLRAVIRRAAKSMSVGTRGRNYAVALGSTRFQTLSRTSLFFDEEWRRAMLVGGNGAHPTPEELRVELTAGARSMLQGMQRIDFRSYMVDDILVKVDRASMLASLETRAPFLDPAVIEFAFARVPDRLKTTFNQRKILLRTLAARLLPSELDLHRKQGFTIPLSAWFAGEWGPMMRDVLAQADPRLFRPAAIADLFARQGKTGNQLHRIYALTVFEMWRREYDIAIA
ncbi:MAG: asparagine synthase (glutamine-hydrolyzing) [Thermoanaerobaculia bacterium]